jgi:hypothetical protein
MPIGPVTASKRACTEASIFLASSTAEVGSRNIFVRRAVRGREAKLGEPVSAGEIPEVQACRGHNAVERRDRVDGVHWDQVAEQGSSLGSRRGRCGRVVRRRRWRRRPVRGCVDAARFDVAGGLRPRRLPGRGARPEGAVSQLGSGRPWQSNRLNWPAPAEGIDEAPVRREESLASIWRELIPEARPAAGEPSERKGDNPYAPPCLRRDRWGLTLCAYS